MTYFIYILRLAEGKYYVGLTKDLYHRLDQHFHKKGSEWTKLYEPIEVEKVIESDSSFDEDKWTKIMMEKYGIKNVRGGSYISIELQPEQEKLLVREQRTRNQSCFKCGSKGHFANRCLNITQLRKDINTTAQKKPKRRQQTTFDRKSQQNQQRCFKRQHNQIVSNQIPCTEAIKIQSQSEEDSLFNDIQSGKSKPTKILKRDTNATNSCAQPPSSKDKEAQQ